MNNAKLFGLAAAVAFAFATTSTGALADADGGKLFKKKCGSCHTLEAGKHKVGPSLAGVMGRKAGTTDFGKYKALKDADWTWDEDTMDEWIADQKKFLKARDIKKKTSMSAKIKKEDDREAIIEYLKNNG